MDPDITQLATMMRARRAAGGAPYVLLLGSSLSLTPEVRRAVCGSDDWETFWTAVEKMSPAERRAAFKRPLERLLLAEGYRALTRLLAAGYFEVVFTLNVDDTLDNELSALKADEYRIWVYGEVTSAELVAALEYRSPRVKVLKLRGDVNAHELPLTPKGQFEFPPDLEHAVRQWLSRDTMVVGDLPFDDDVWRCLRRGESALWLVEVETSERLHRVKQARKKGEAITVELFNAFFTALADALEVEEVRPAWEMPPQNPYQGLEAFTQDKAQFFFGRERLTEKLLERLRRERFLAVVGASGSGKSSVVQAGLLHRLAQGALPGSADWPTPVGRPGELADALARLLRGTEGLSADERQDLLARLLADETAIDAIAERVLQDAPPDHRLVLVVDQFEELFTLESAAYREQVIAALLYAVRVAGGRTTMVVTMRSDFYAQVAEYDDLFVWMEQHRVFVPPMGETELRDAIQRPARLVKFPLDDSLTETILTDVGREPGALPLLQYALKELYDRWQEGLTPSQAYGEIGGVHGALEHRADQVYQDLSDRQQAVARHILIRLTQLGEGTEDTRRRATFAELVTPKIALVEIEAVIDILATAQTRLLVTDDPDKERPGQTRVVEVAHEALIRGWEQLQTWLNEDRAGLLLRQRLGEDAWKWADAGRHEDYLYRGLELDNALDWAKAHEGELSKLEQEFLDASQKRQRQEEQRWKDLYEEAKQQARLATSRQLAAQSQIALEKHPQRSLLLAVEALKITMRAGEPRVPAAEDALRQALANSGGRSLSGHEGSIDAMAISPDNRWLVTGSYDFTARLWDLTAPDPAAEPIVLRGHEAPIFHVAISPDNHWLVTGSGDNTARLWDLTAPDPAAEPIVLRGHEDVINDVAISPDNHWLVTGSRDNTARLWDLTAPDPAAEPIVLRGHEYLVFAAISPDSHWLVTTSGGLFMSNIGDNTARLWDLTARKPGAKSIVLRGHEGPIPAVAISRDNHWLVTGSYDNTARLWDLTARKPGAKSIVLRGHEDDVNAAAISPDNHWLVTGSDDNTARLWNLTAPDPAAEPIILRGHEGSIFHVAISPDNHWLVTAGYSPDNTARLWDLTAPDPAAEPIVLRGHEGAIFAAAISLDNRWLVTRSEENTARLWDLTTPDPAREPIVLRGHGGYILAVAVSPDNHWLVTGSQDNTARLWDLTAPDPAAKPIVLRGHEDVVNAVAISPDNHWLVTSSQDNTARLCDLTAPDPAAAPIVLPYGGTPVAVSPDNHWLVTGSDDNTARLWDLTAPDPAAKPIVLRGHEDVVNAVAISPDNHWLVTGSQDNTARLWDLTAPDPAAAPIVLRGHEGSIFHVAISPDNHWLVTGSDDNTARLWDLTAPDPVTAAIVLPDGRGRVAFSTDNHWLVSGSGGHTARLWDLTVEDPSAEPIVLRGHESAITAVAISPDNHWLVTTSGDWLVAPPGAVLSSPTGDNTARLWDLTAEDPAAEPLVLRGHEGYISAVAVSPDNHWLVTGSWDGTARLWNLRLDELIDLACRTAGRNLTRAEWERYFPEQEYRKTCEQWPLEGE